MNSISTKLFLTLLGLTAVTLITTISLARWGFEYGFLDYRRSLEVERLQNMEMSLLAHYESNGGQWNVSTSAEFDSILRRSLPSQQRRQGEPSRRPPPPKHSFEDRRNGGFDKESRNRPPPRGPDGFDRALRNGPLPRGPVHKTALYDLRGNHIAGDILLESNANFISVPIIYNDSQIGELRALVVAQAITPEEKAFARQQTLASIIIAVLALLLASVASWFLSRTLLTPIFTLKKGIGSLAKGDFAVELPNDRQDELGELMADINRLSSVLDQNRASRRRWLADVSHELRTPVTILAGEIEAMKDGVRSLDLNGIDSLAHETDRLKHLIDDLYQLSLSEVGGLRYEFKNIDLAESLHTIVKPFISRAKTQGLSLGVNANGPHYVSGDSIRLEQLFINLLNNSIYYTDSPGVIELRMYQDDANIIITIDDSAPGAAEGDFDSLFKPLFRIEESRNRSLGGAGLGLTICKNIVEAHQGQIIAGQSPFGGIRIQITLPAL